MLGGRQILWMLIDAYKTNSNMMTSYTWKDIDSVQWLGDAKLDVFWTKWRMIIDALEVDIPKPTIEEAFFERIKTSEKLKPDIHLYRRSQVGSENHSLEFLEEAVMRQLNQEQQDTADDIRKRRATSRLLPGINDEYALGAAGSRWKRRKGKGKGKKGKGKGKKGEK